MQPKVKVRFAYKYGVRRAWLVISCLWIIILAMTSWSDAHGDLAGYAQVLLLMGVLPAFVLYALAAALVWVVEGFARAE